MSAQARLKTKLQNTFLFRRRAEEAIASLPDLMSAAERAALSVLSGGHAQKKSGSGEKFWQFREYTSTDRPQDIDWRQSAKGERVFIRQKEWQTSQTNLLWVQGDDGMFYRSSTAKHNKYEDSIVMALALSILLTRSGELAGLLNGDKRPGRGPKTIEAIGQDLIAQSKLDDNKQARLPHPGLQHIPSNASIILIGDFLSDLKATQGMMDGLAARAINGLLIHVLDPAEINLPFHGRVIFEEIDDGGDYQVSDVDAVRAAYQNRIQDHCAGLAQICRHHNWNYLLHRTDQDVALSLFDAWRLIGGRGASVIPNLKGERT